MRRLACVAPEEYLKNVDESVGSEIITIRQNCPVTCFAFLHILVSAPILSKVTNLPIFPRFQHAPRTTHSFKIIGLVIFNQPGSRTCHTESLAQTMWSASTNQRPGTKGIFCMLLGMLRHSPELSLAHYALSISRPSHGPRETSLTPPLHV